MKDGRTPNPRTGRVTPAPIRPLTPIVASERNVALSTFWPTSATVAAGATSGMPGTAAVTGCETNASRTHRNPNTRAMIAPTISAGTLMTRPTRMQATPIAKPIGQRLGPGRCWSSCSLTRWLRPSPAPVRDSTARTSPMSTGNPPRPPPASRGQAILHSSAVDVLRQPELAPPGVDPRPDLRCHLDLGRPRARPFVRPLRRRVEADLAAEAREHGRVVELVERPVREDDVPLRVDVRAHAEEDLLVVVDVDVGVDDHDGLRQREEPEAPDCVHHLARVPREALADREDDAVVERAGGRQVVVDDLGDAHADRRQEDPFRRLGEPLVLGGRLADDDRRVDRVAAHRDRRDAEERELLGRRVVARVVAKGALDPGVRRVDPALEHDLR